jgi:hypothetical protein
MLDKSPNWNVDYVAELAERQSRLLRIRSDKRLLLGAKEYYKTHPLEFIEHWGVTYDPRNTVTDTPALIPFIPFKRQREFIQYLNELIEDGESGLVEKSRDMGATWVAVLFSVWLWIFKTGSSVGWGSRKAKLVDEIGNPDSIFQKIRIAITNLPVEFLPAGFSLRDHMSFMRIINPDAGSTIVGEAGDDIGRGGRSTWFVKDESAHYEHPEAIEAALSDNALVQLDISSVNGTGNVFHRRREAGIDWYPGGTFPKGRVRVFVMDWRDHPSKSQKWYELRKQKFEDEGLAHIFAQEVDRDYSAAIEGVIIPAVWVKSAIDAHIALGIKDDGNWCGGLDVADEGGDTNALALRRGVVLRKVEEWGTRDTGVTARRAVTTCGVYGDMDLQYDCIGIGAGIKAETNRLKDDELLPKGLWLVPWNAGAEVINPDEHVIKGDKQSPLNKDFYANLKAQAWWSLRRRFELTHRAITEKGFTYDTDDLISIDSKIPLLRKIEKELSQPTAGQSSKLKLLVNKKPEGAKSPNLADAIVMNFFPLKSGRVMKITQAVLQRARMPFGRRR